VPAEPVESLAGARIAIGASAWLAPNLSGRLFGLDPKGNPQASFLGRLFGARDLALGIGTLTSEGEARRLWLRLGVLCDTLDFFAAWLGARSGALPKHAAALSGTAALGAAGMGVAALASGGE
jgi:hypothetical protein